MLIALSEFRLRLLCGVDSKGNFKLPYGLKKNLGDNEKKLIENVYNWCTGKNIPRASTFKAMRDGEFGDAGSFAIKRMDAIEQRDYVKFTEVLHKDLDRVYEGFDDGLDVVHTVDRKIGEYLISGNDEVLLAINLPRVLNEHVKTSRTTGVLSKEAACLFYLYFWFCIESKLPNDSHKPFKMIFEDHKSKTLYDSFIKIIRSGIRKRKHKMAEIHKRLNKDYKEFDNILRTPSRFCNPDFLKHFADAYYELCFLNESKKPQDSDAQFAVWNHVAHAVWIMDKAQKAWNIDFRILAKDHFDEFRTAVSS